MLPKSPGTSNSGKPVRRLKLPKIGPAKTKSLFEEYFYTLLGVVFVSVAILGKAGGFNTYNTLIVAAWITGFIWFVRQWRGYVAEKSKAENGKAIVPPAETPATAHKGPLPLPQGMKPMIGPQWPMKPGSRPAWPGLPKERPATAAESPASQPSGVQTPGAPSPNGQSTETANEEKKRVFVYERPTLPDRKPKLPNNWGDPKNKKPKQ